MKKFILAAATALLTAVSASAVDLDVHYKGYVDTFGGTMFPFDSDMEKSGPCYGLSTTHGVQLFDGFFVGGGIDLNFTGAELDDDDFKTYTQFAVFAAARYNFLHEKKWQPFVNLRLGYGYVGIGDGNGIYVAPEAGCTFNLNEHVGFDAGLRYNHYLYVANDDPYMNGALVFALGVHFSF